MNQCQAKVGGACTRSAVWKQSVHAGDRPSGRILYWTFWCDEHAQRVIERRRTNWIAPALMERIEETEPASSAPAASGVEPTA